MNELLDDDDPAVSHGERELTLSTGAILGIFFGLVLLCGACFGVGYNMGRKTASPAPLAINDTGSEAAADANSGSKPAAGSLADNATSAAPATVTPTPKPAPVVRKPPPPAADDDTSDTAATSATPAATPPAHAPIASPAPVVRTVHPSALLPGVGSPSAAAQSGNIMVQVAAVSHQEDADLLVGALRARGYTVSAHPLSSDGFIHVQVGPFSNKPEAEAMRQRLLHDGYNAMLKY